MTSTEHSERAAEALGLSFADLGLLERALTHPSWSEEHGGGHYERLEFLGDSVLGLIVSEHLHQTFPELAEGDLSRMKSALVRTRALSDAARELGIGQFIRLGRGAAQDREGERPSVLEAVFEAIVGAVYLDSGVETARSFALGVLLETVDLRELAVEADDPKTQLQHLVQARGLGLPLYRSTGHDGPPHGRTFHVEVLLASEVVGSGSGPSKQAAGQAAAAAALAVLADD
jgi:ribonuclease-3